MLHLLSTLTLFFYNPLLRPTATTHGYDPRLRPTATTHGYDPRLRPTATNHSYDPRLLACANTYGIHHMRLLNETTNDYNLSEQKATHRKGCIELLQSIILL